jgi:solute carrier family 34 (sodium-dependent phosphate cotransporter)
MIQKTQTRLQFLLNIIVLLLVLYTFFCSIELLSKSIKLFGSGFANQLLTLTSNPFVALFIGIGATALMQSSSATTSMVVAMVASGSLSISLAVPIIMGANIGTSVTNTLVSVGHINRNNEFRRAFAASTVHDMFNLLAVGIFFPIELFTGVFSKSGIWMSTLLDGSSGLKLFSPLKAIIKPTVKSILSFLQDVFANGNLVPWVGLAIALALLFFAISRLTIILKKVFMGSAEGWFQKHLFNHPLKALGIGMVLTAAVQSSSISTSLIIPMAGAGILTIQQIFPYTLGANIGTTITAIMASMATQNPAAVSIALVHLLFNISGTVLVWPFRSVPIFLSTTLAEFSLKSKFIPFAYILFTFILLPLGVIFLTH